MNIIFISDGTLEYDGRLRELIKVAKELGSTIYLTRAISPKSKQENSHIIISKLGNVGYFYLILKSLVVAINIKKIDVLFLDNRKSIIPGMIVNLLKKPKHLVLDVRELYMPKEVKHLVGKIGCYLEAIMIKKADVIICANKYRASIMKEYYSLEKEPLVYENIRKLKKSHEYSDGDLFEKYGDIFKKKTMKVISTSGWSISRTNDQLVKAMRTLGEGYELYLVGGGTEKDELIIRNLVEQYQLYNVHLINIVNTDELIYLINNCNIGVVNYNQIDLNNKYCASGKIFEFLFEGLPIITTENTPLMDICEVYKIGISDNNYWSGILNIVQNYDYYKKNVNEYINNIDVEENNMNLRDNILSALSE